MPPMAKTAVLLATTIPRPIDQVLLAELLALLPQKPWRVARNYADFRADKMLSETTFMDEWCRSMGRVKWRPSSKM